MLRLCLTLDSPSENLALDEALLDAADTGGPDQEVLRLWEPSQGMIVLGRTSRFAEEVDVAAARRLGFPVLRRTSGGATIVTGPGCLMYAVVLSYERRPELRSISRTHEYVLGRMATALRTLVPEVTQAGISDLVCGDRKFSGNSLRCKRSALLYHGTLLYDFPLGVIAQCLKTPPRQPEYREGREHQAFVMNLPCSADAMRQAIATEWQANAELTGWPRSEVERLVTTTYGRRTWTEQR